MLVVDCSMTLAWLFADERTAVIDSVLDKVLEEGALVPMLWHLEVANSLTMAVRRQRITQSDRNESLRDLKQLNIVTDVETLQFAWSTTIDLAERHGLTAYDACYLELAQRHHLPLATLDAALARAATAAGVAVLPS